MKKILLQAHRGVAAEYPENTMAAFRAAVNQGYDIIELDPDYTADEELVVFHDKHSINRTARNADGSNVEKEICLRDITYAEAMKYDYGISFDKRFKGEKLPLLKEVFDFAADNGIPLKLDNKIQAFPENILEKLLELCDKTDASVGFTCATIDFARLVAERYPHAHIHFDGEANEKNLKTLSSFVPKDRLTVWIAFPNELTEWVQIPRASRELCALIKEYANLGIWIIHNKEDYIKACEEFGADVVETTGRIKPELNHGIVADMHTHSENSHDSVCPVSDMAKAQIAKGTKAFAVTDHCDVEHSDTVDVESVIRSSYKDATRNANIFAEKIDILCGVEMGTYPGTEELCEKILGMQSYDVVIGSVHTLKINGKKMVYSQMDFSAVSDEEIHNYITAYFEEILNMLRTMPVDILAHLTCPLRYINGKYGRNIDLSAYDEYIIPILEHIIAHAIALEINTSGFACGYDSLMPDKRIIEMYKKMGGYLITLASDAHSCENASIAFEYALEHLKSAEFENIYYYKNRIAIPCRI